MGKLQKIKRNFMKIVMGVAVLALIYFSYRGGSSTLSLENMDEAVVMDDGMGASFENEADPPIYEDGSSKPYEYQEREEDYTFDGDADFIDRDSL
jgi:hypothetical protein